MSTTISMDILARDRASRTLDHIGDKADRSAQRWATMGRVAKNAGLMVGAGLAVAATAAVKLTQAAMEDQQAAVQLATAYRNNADAKNGEIAASEKWITAQGRALGVTDDELRPALAQLVTATHDVGEAQKQASLAMNIAAGRNVALATVTKALEKAQNGSLGGLSKLGVKTKNAAGDTLSLDTITRKLADTYRGQAAKSADTAAGKFGRLKLTLTETGEAIGYKLLPYAENLTDWILNNGVPMAEDLWAAWENNGIDGVVSKIEALTDTQGDLKPIVDDVRKALGAAGDIITGSLIPAVGDITAALPRFMSPLGLVADTLGFMADHADLTKYALIGLTGVLTVNRAQMLLSKVAGSELVTSLTQQGTAAEKAAAKTRLLGAAARGAAGMAGMLLLTRAADESDGKLATLESTAGGMALGFAVGGPWGAAIGGAIGLLKGLSDASGKADDAFEGTIRMANALGEEVGSAEAWAAVGVTAYDRIRSSLNDLTGAYTKTTKAAVYNSLEEEGAFKGLASLGLSRREVTAATLGNAKAIAKVNAALDPHAIKTDRAARAAQALEGGMGAAGATLRNTTRDIRNQADATEPLRRRLGLTRKEYAKFPALVKTLIKNDAPDSMREIRKLSKQVGGLDRKTAKILVSALGTEPTKKRMDAVMADLRKVDGTRVSLKGWLTGIKTAVNEGAKFTGVERKTIQDKLEAIEKANPNLAPYVASVRTAVSNAAGEARESTTVGHNLKAGLLSGMYGTGTALSSLMTSAVRNAIAAARREADIHSPSRKTYEIGHLLAKGAVDGMSDNKHKLSEAGADLMASIVKGIRKGEVPMQRVLDAVTSQVQRTLDRVKRLKDARAATVSDFQGFSTSLFAAQAPESGGFTVDSLLAFQSAERDKAKSVEAAVIKLTDMGLSGSLIKQMRGQGSAGIDQLLALSQGNQAQISLANSLNAQTQAAYGAAGMNVANTMQGSEEREARRDARLAKQIAAAVHEAIQDREAKYEFVLKGNTLVAILKKEHRDNPSNGNRP